MGEEPKPPKEKAEIHIEYEVHGEKTVEDVSSTGDPCVDHIASVIHQKDEAEALVKFLKGRGFSVRLWRKSATPLIDDEFPSEKPE